MATTIDVVPLHPEDNVTEPRVEKVETSSETNEKAEQTHKKRGRPAGAKDLKRRKTPVRRKRGDAQSPPPVIEEPAVSEAIPAAIPAAIEPANEPAAAPLPQAAALSKAAPKISHFQRLYMQHFERQSAREAHWDGIVTPMFRFPVF